MKRTIALSLIVLMAFFAGCSSEKPSVEKETSKKKIIEETIKKAEETEKKIENAQAELKNEQPAEPARIEIDGIWFSFIGTTSDTIAEAKGEMSENLWADGPLYRFGNENVWYSFENYEYAQGNNYVPIGECTGVAVPLSMFLLNTEDFSAYTLEEAIGAELVEGFDVMDEINTYSVEHNGYRLMIYEYSKEDIVSDSMVNIRRI